MYAIRQIIEDPQESIPVPPEFRHRLTEVVFLALDENFKPDSCGELETKNDSTALAETRADLAAGQIVEESPEAHLERITTL